MQNLPVPFDRRVWLEATSLTEAGYTVSVICPKAKGYSASFETLEGVAIYRYGLPIDAQGAIGFVLGIRLVLPAQLHEIGPDRRRRPRLRRHPCLQSAGDVLAARLVLAPVRQALPVRPPRPVARDVRRQVRPRIPV